MCDTPSAGAWLLWSLHRQQLKPDPLTPGPVCYDLSLSHSLAPVDKHMLSLQWRGSDTCLQRCTVRLSGRANVHACSVCCLYVDNVSVTETHGGRRRRNWRRALGIQLDGDCVCMCVCVCVKWLCRVWECLARLQWYPTERESCLMWPWIESHPHPLNRPGPLMSGGHTEPWQLRGHIVTPNAWQPRHAMLGPRSALPSQKGEKKAERRKFRLHGQQTITVNAHLSLKHTNWVTKPSFEIWGLQPENDRLHLCHICSVYVTWSETLTPAYWFWLVLVCSKRVKAWNIFFLSVLECLF